jgi:hypothetical protein
MQLTGENSCKLRKRTVMRFSLNFFSISPLVIEYLEARNSLGVELTTLAVVE